VDLDRTSSRLLSLHMGSENYERFRNFAAPAAPTPSLQAAPL
jgi:hypothetical protein